MGKFTSKKLSEIIDCIKTSKKVVLPPIAGCDAGVYAIDNDQYMVVSTDPCTGVPQDWFAWLLIHYSASDVALFGAHPRLASINLLGPPGTSHRVFKQVMSQVCKVAEDLGVDIITGHTGNYPSLSELVGVCTMQGFIQKDRIILPTGSQSGDLILMVKSLGLETLTNFSLTHDKKSKELFGSKKTKYLQSAVPAQSCVDEALLLAERWNVHAMHDITEGGLVTALNDMAENSHLGFEIFFEKIPIKEEVRLLQRYFNLSLVELLSLSSTGSFLISIPPSEEDEIIRELKRKDINAVTIGEFKKEKKRFITINNKKTYFFSEAKDPYMKIFYSK